MDKKDLIKKMMNPEEKKTGHRTPTTFFKKLQAFLNKYWLKVILPVLIVLYFCFTFYYYNLFVELKQNVENAKAHIKSCLQRRENLVPVLQMALADFVKHENNVFFNVTDMRTSVRSSKSEVQSPKSTLGLSKLFAVAEKYPDLKVNESFQLLMSEVSKVEKEILEKRIEYNNAVRKLNIKIDTFPSGIVSWIFGFKKALYFEWKGKPEWVTTLKEKTTITNEEIKLK